MLNGFNRARKPAGLLSAPTAEPLEPRLLLAADVVLSEIMYHPYAAGLPNAQTENLAEEYVELYNRGDASANLTGWRLADGVDFTFPAATLGAGEYLVVASDVAAFSAKYPGVTNVVGGWFGRLSNSGEDIELEDAFGVRIDRVEYADEGDWAQRIEGPLDLGHTGWTWSDEHDGAGKSLELINPMLTNNIGNNWSASLVDHGTPGATNSVASADVAPLVRDVSHCPIIPGSSDPVTINAEIVDELTAGLSVFVQHRTDGDPAFTATRMHDDGLHGDGAAGDGVYGAALPARPDGTIVEWYVEASDAGANTRTWPAPVPGHGQAANLLYQVDDSHNPGAKWNEASQPMFRLIMTDAERDELVYIGSHSSDANSDAQMNGTFVTHDGVDTKVRYQVGIRNRGHGSRARQPNNYRVNLPSDSPWNGTTALNINAQATWVQLAGSAIMQLSGVPAADAMPVRVLVNGEDRGESGSEQYGSYVYVEVIDGEWAANHFPADDAGNVYKALRVGSHADLDYDGTDPDDYRARYEKKTNVSQDDYTDLFDLTYVLSQNTPDSIYVDEVNRVMDVDEWLRYFAVNTLLDNSETNLSSGNGDDYFLYRGAIDARFRVIPWDLDSVFGEGDNPGSTTSGIFRATALPVLDRFLKHPEFAPRYYAALTDLIETTFSPEQMGPFLDNLLGGYVPQGQIDDMKDFVAARNAHVLSLIPSDVTISSALPQSNGYDYSTTDTIDLTGTAPAAETRKILVNGAEVGYSPWEGAWNTAELPEGELVLANGVEWLYLDDGSDQGSAWKEVSFPDELTWSSGNAQLGYGDGDENTVVSYGDDPDNKPITTYFRKTFDVADASRYASLRLYLLRDDGAVVYLNGQEVFRSNMPQGAIDYQTPASSTTRGGEEDDFFTTAVDPILLVSGPNSLAVEVHQRSASSPDISFDLKLEGYRASNAQVSLLPGINGVLVQAMDANDNEIARRTVGVWYDDGDETVVSASPAADTTWTAANGPYHVTASLTVPAGVTLTIEPGTTVFFDAGVSLTVSGRLDAQGTDSRRIHLASVPGGGAWGGLYFDGTVEDNRIAYASISSSDSGSQSIDAVDSRVHLDNVVWSDHGGMYLDWHDSAIVLSNSYLPSISDAELIHFWGMPADGYAIFEGNTFGSSSGYNDVIDFTGGQRPGPIAQFRNNLFLGSSDDVVDLDAADAHVEGNVFMNVHQDAPRDSLAHAVSTGTEYGEESNITVVGNLFYDVDYAILIKDGGYGTIVNNTIVGATKAAINVFEDRSGQWQGDGIYLAGNIFHDVASLFSNPDWAGHPVPIQIDSSIVYPDPGETLHWSDVNISYVDPLLTNTAAVTDLVADFALRAGSPAVGTGPNGRDMGGLIPAGAAISGEPPQLTRQTSATLAVGGPEISGYKYRVNGGAWSAEVLRPFLADSPPQPIAPIQLTGLTDGDYTVDIITKDSADVWQDEADAVASHTWTVDTSLSRLRINEVLAWNVSALDHEGTRPDVIELYNDSASPIDLGGMSISDDPLVPTKFVFQAGTAIGAEDYLLLYADIGALTSGIHVGFGLSNDGDGVYLYDSGQTLVDSVEFGIQLPDLSVGRVGADGHWALTRPTLPGENIELPTGETSTLKINEWFTNGQYVLVNDFIELYNPQPVPVNVGGLALTDQPITQPAKNVIPALSFIATEGFEAFIADEDLDGGAHHVNFRLSSGHETIGLFGANGELIDQVLHNSQATDITQMRTPDGGSEYGFFRLPTPGVSNPGSLPGRTVTIDLIEIDHTWSYDQSDVDLAAAWRDPDFDDSLWPTGAALLYVEGSSLPEAKNTPLTIGATTYYFRTEFTWSGEVDTTPPSAPANVAGAPVSDVRIDLSWDAAADAESGVSHYVIYRDGQQHDTAAGTSYSDAGLTPSTGYIYEIAAVNGFGIEGARSEPAVATTLADTEVPTLQTVTVVDDLTIELAFSEALDQATAETAGNYALTAPAGQPVGIASADLEADGLTVTLTPAAALAADTPYLLGVANVEDVAGNPVAADTREEIVLPPDSILLPRGSEWRYLDDGSDQGTAWKEVSFPPADLWASGNAQLGYGDGDENTLLGYGGDGQNKYITYYFRTTFEVADASKVTALTAHLIRDDGAVVWLNGDESFRSNMAPTGAITYTTRAFSSTGGDEEDTYYVHAMDPGDLVDGQNVLAVEVHQYTNTSSDISLDIELEATILSSRPAGTDDGYTTDRNVTLNPDALAGVLANDSDPAPGPQAMSAVLVDDVAHGQLTLQSDGAFEYVPAVDYVGADGFTYRAYDGEGYSNLITVTIDVQLPAPPGGAAAVPEGSLTMATGTVTDLLMTTIIDDGAIFYLNGNEAYLNGNQASRLGMDSGAYDHDTLANRTVGDADWEGPFSLPLQYLVTGRNVLAVEVHQTTTTSTDIVFGMDLDAEVLLPDEGGENELSRMLALFDGLRITEVMYNPVGGSDYEFIEIRNIGIAELDLTGVRLRGGVEFDFPAMTLAGGEYVVVAGNLLDFAARYGAGLNAVGPFIGNLANGGEDIILRLPEPYDAAALRFEYDDAWYPSTDGDGLSLVINDESAGRRVWSEQAGWRASGAANGSPGADDPAPQHAAGSVVVNEVLAHSDGGVEDWIELHNTTEADIDVSGWFLSDSGAQLQKYVIPGNPSEQFAPGNTIIPAGGYVVFNELNHLGPLVDPVNGFALSELGDDVIVSSADATGQLGTYRHQVVFGATANGMTVGRHTTSTGRTDFTELSAPTMEGPNAAPLVGDVVIEQIMYRPAVGGHEYVLLHNRTASPVDLFDPLNPANTWQFTDGIDFVFPQGVTIPADGYALVTELDGATFRATYDIPAVVQIFGPFENGTGLSNAGETLRLSRPGTPEVQPPPLPVIVPQLLVDVVNFDDDLPWVEEPDGDGPALLRLDNTAYGSDPINWTISAPPAVTVDPLTTPDATPALTGTVDNAMAHVYVTVDGTQYTAVNNGDGTWTLPDDTIGPALADGTYDVQARTIDHVGTVGTDGTLDELTVDGGDRPPTIERVLVGSTSWDATFLAGLGDIGYAVPEGVDQLDELPWVNLNQLMIVFSEPVTAALEDLSLYGVHTPEYTVASFDYDVDTLTATWTLSAPVAAADKLLAVLADTVTDAGGNALDGEWSDGISTYSSGDGQAGGDFSYRLNVLPGDTDQSGEVRSSDVIKVRRKGNTAPGDADYSPLYDVDGSGEIRSSDVIKVRRLGNTALPAGEPTVPPSAPSSLTVEAMLQAAAAAAADSDDETPSTDLDDPLVDVLAASAALIDL